MADSHSTDGLQPSLLDRLVLQSGNPGAGIQKDNSHKFSAITSRRLQKIVRRDLEVLLNTGCLSDVVDLSNYPLVSESVINFGIPNLTGGALENIDAAHLAKQIKKTILQFETRIMPESLKVSVSTSEEMNHRALRFEIECHVWGQSSPEYLLLRTELDPESGTMSVVD